MKKHDDDPPACVDCAHYACQHCYSDACSTFDSVAGRQPVTAEAARQSYCGPDAREFKAKHIDTFMERNILWIVIGIGAIVWTVAYWMDDTMNAPCGLSDDAWDNGPDPRPTDCDLWLAAERALRGVGATGWVPCDRCTDPIDCCSLATCMRADAPLIVQSYDLIDVLDTIARLRRALEPFAIVGRPLIAAGKSGAIPPGVSARFLKLEPLQARHFSDAALALDE